MQATVSGPGTLKFYWKVSSESGYDYLEFYIDDVRQHRISGTVDWTQKTYSISSGSHTLKWRYMKDGSRSSGSDSGWVDKVEWDVTTPPSLSDFVVTSITLNPSSPTANGTFSVDVVVKNQGTAAGDGKTLSVWVNQGSNQNCGASGDKSTSVGTLQSGESKTFTFSSLSAGSSGSKTFRAYVDSGCGTSESDENNNQLTKSYTVSSPPTNCTLGEAVDNTSLTFTTGGGANWFCETTTTYNGGDAAQSGAITHNQESWMQTTVSGPGTLRFYWKVSSEGNYDFLEFYIDGVLQHQITGAVDWVQKSYTISSGSHTLKWRYMKDVSNSLGNDCGWVDKVEWIR
jgi:hypothetical protein